MNVNFLHIGKDNELPTRMVASVKEAMPNAVITQLTDMNTDIIKGVNSVIRKPFKGFLMQYRLEHLVALRGEWVSLDTDIIVKKDLKKVFNNEFDVALTKRTQSIISPDGMDVAKVMPYNAGVMFSRNHEFWEDALTYLKTLSDQDKTWWGDQLAIKHIADKKYYKVHELDCSEYNYTPKNKDERKDVFVYHFKGERKSWMLDNNY